MAARSRAREEGFREIQVSLMKIAATLRTFLEKLGNGIVVAVDDSAKTKVANKVAIAPIAGPQSLEEEVAATSEAPTIDVGHIDNFVAKPEAVEWTANIEDIVAEPKAKEEQIPIAVEASACTAMALGSVPVGICGQGGLASIHVTKGAAASVVIVGGRRGNSSSCRRLLDKIKVFMSTDEFYRVHKFSSTVILKSW